MTELSKSILLFEYDESIEAFTKKEIENKELSEFLDSNLIYIIVDNDNQEILIWHGKNANIRMKFIATQEAPKIRDKYGNDYKIIAIDDGNESSKFKEIAGF